MDHHDDIENPLDLGLEKEAAPSHHRCQYQVMIIQDWMIWDSHDMGLSENVGLIFPMK